MIGAASITRVISGKKSKTFPWLEIIDKVFIVFLSLLVLGIIILIKATSIYDYAADPLLVCYTIFITTFELSRIYGALFFKRLNDKIIQHAEAAVASSEPYEPMVSIVIPCKNEEGAIR